MQMNWLVDDFPPVVPVDLVALCGEFAWGKNVTRDLWNLWAAKIHMVNFKEFKIACINGHLPMVQWCADSSGFDLPHVGWKCFSLACGEGRLGVVQWLVANGVYVPRFPFGFGAACDNDHSNVAQWLVTQNIVDLSWAFRAACAHGCLDMVKWLLANGMASSSNLNDGMRYACCWGRLGVVKWLFHAGITDRSGEGCKWARSSGYHDVVQWLEGQK